MTVLKVVEWPAKVLETPAEKVTSFDKDLQQFVADMHETMHAAGGIGLAANQVGVLKRVLTIQIPWHDARENDPEEKQEWWHNKSFTFINPEITKKSGKFNGQEGCLSFPGIYDFVNRAAEVWVSAVDEHGKPFEVHATGLLSICLQHEIDHIDGIVFIERMSALKSTTIRKKIFKRRQTTDAELV